MATSADGKTSEVEMFSTSQFERLLCPIPSLPPRMEANGIKRLLAMARAAFIPPQRLQGRASERRCHRIKSSLPLAIPLPRERRFAP